MSNINNHLTSNLDILQQTGNWGVYLVSKPLIVVMAMEYQKTHWAQQLTGL